MSAIPGTIGITGPLAPKDSADTYAVGDTQYIKGAPLQLANLSALQNYNYPDRLRIGQWGYATDTGKIYVLGAIGSPNTWSEFTGGSSLTADQLAAIQGANTPNASNVFATMNDLSGTVVPAGKEESSNPNSPKYYSGLQINTAGQTAFTISTTPLSEDVFSLYLNGKKCSVGSGNEFEYSRIGTAITWNNSGPSGQLAINDELIAQYNCISSGAGYSETGNILVTTWSAPTGAPPNTNIRLVKIGKFVSIWLSTWAATSNGGSSNISSVAAVIPSQYRPASDTFGHITVRTNATTNNGAQIQIGSNGVITIWADYSTGSFSPPAGQAFGFSQGSWANWILL